MDKDVKKGTKILLDDGKLVTEVLNVKNEEIEVITKNTHMLKTNKRVNIPGVDFSLPFMSEKDKNDIA
ncbi:pyruvate kinase [Chlamydia abortus]|nr:pyruvate kinase [Chlamydia abortus]